jgi:hypothetical protein
VAAAAAARVFVAVNSLFGLALDGGSIKAH